MSGESEKEISPLLKTQNSKLDIRIVLVVEYDGTNYCGFQFQVNAPTIQDEIEKALLKLTGERTRVVGTSRTDAGVHAKGQVVSFKTNSILKSDNFIRGLNYYLPQDIAVKAAYKVNNRFNVQREAISREYQYYILNSRTRSPIKQGWTYLVNQSLDIETMDQASQLLIGEHDFASFVTEISQSNIKSTVRIVYKVGVEKRRELVVYSVIANSFLPHQVRNTVGTLIRVGLGKISIKDFQTIIEEKKPGLAGLTVPAKGLFLMQVNYPRPLGDYDEDL
jgi:tRNA pseudouridine38-40 synthase